MDQEKHILEQTHSCTHMLNISIKHTHRPHIHTYGKLQPFQDTPTYMNHTHTHVHMQQHRQRNIP